MQITNPIILLSGIALLMSGGLAYSQGLPGNTKAPPAKSELMAELFKSISDGDKSDGNKKRIHIIQGEDYVVIKTLGVKDKSLDAVVFNDPKPKVGSIPTITPTSLSGGGTGQLDSITLQSKILSAIDSCKAPKVFLHIDSYQCLSKEEVAKK